MGAGIISFLTIFPNYICFKKRKPQAQKDVTQSKFPNWGLIPNLIAISTSTRNVASTDHQETLLSISANKSCHLCPLHPLKKDEVICTIRPLAISPRKQPCLEQSFFTDYSYAPTLFNKILPFCTTPGSASLFAWWSAADP